MSSTKNQSKGIKNNNICCEWGSGYWVREEKSGELSMPFTLCHMPQTLCTSVLTEHFVYGNAHVHKICMELTGWRNHKFALTLEQALTLQKVSNKEWCIGHKAILKVCTYSHSRKLNITLWF